MGCSDSSIKVKSIIENRSFSEYKNIKTIERLEPELSEDYGVVFFMELKYNKFLISTQNGKVVIYDKINYTPLTIIDLKDYSANTIIKLKDGKFLFGCDGGKLFLYSINEKDNSYEELNSFDFENNLTKIIEDRGQIIISDYSKITFIDSLFDNNKINIKKTYKDHLIQLDIFNIFLFENLLLSFAYAQRDNTPNELIIHNIDNDEIVFKQSNASVMPWNQTVYHFSSNILAITGNECEICLFDIKTFKILAKISDLDFFYSVICLGNKIFCGSNDGEIYEFEYNAEKNELVNKNKFKIHESSIYSISRTLDGEIVTVSRDGTIKFFKVCNNL